MASEQQNPGLDRLVGMWNRRRWPAILVAVTALTATASIVLFLPDVYRSTVSVLVESQQVPQDFVKSTVTAVAERRVQTITQSILSRERLDSLIKRFGLYENLRASSSPEDLIQRMRGDISVDVKRTEQRGPDSAAIAFTISYSSGDPDTAATVANTLASYFIEEDLRSRERQAGGTAEFLRSQLDEIQKKIDAQEIEVSQFKESHLGELPEQRDANLATLERLNTELMLSGEKQIRVWGRAVETGFLEDIWNAPDRGRLRLHGDPATPREPDEVVDRVRARRPGRASTASRSPCSQAIQQLNAARRRAGRRPARHGRGPAGRHQEPRGLRGARRDRADHRAPGARERHRRARPGPVQARRRPALGRAGLRRPVVLPAQARRSTRSSRRPRSTSPARSG